MTLLRNGQEWPFSWTVTQHEGMKEMAGTIKLAIPRGAKTGPDAKPIYGYSEVEAVVDRGLAVHKSLDKSRWRWTVTHVQSGLCLERIGATTKKAAMENMRRALELPIDWTMNEQDTIKALRTDRRIMDGINAIASHA